MLHFPLLYETLTAHSVTDDGTYAYAGSYNVLDSSSTTTGSGARPTTAGRGRSSARRHPPPHPRGAGGPEHRRALRALRRLRRPGRDRALHRPRGQLADGLHRHACVAVDISFDGAGHAIFGQDAPRGGAQIQRLDLADGKTTSVLGIPGASYSALNLNGTFLVGTSREPNGSYPANDPNVHLYGSADGGATFSEYFTIPWQNPNSYVNLLVQHAFPNGDFVIQVDGYGTIVARLAAPGPPPPAPRRAVAAVPLHPRPRRRLR